MFSILSLNLSPLEVGQVKIASGVNISTEGSLLPLIEVCAFTTENEIFPGWNGFNHYSGVVPSRNIIINVGIAPLVGVEVKNDNVVVLGLRVPTSIGVEFVVKGEK
jgi:hypothetical protein